MAIIGISLHIIGDQIFYTDVGTRTFSTGAYFTVFDSGIFTFFESDGTVHASVGLGSATSDNTTTVALFVIGSSFWFGYIRSDWITWSELSDITAYVTGSPAASLDIEGTLDNPAIDIPEDKTLEIAIPGVTALDVAGIIQGAVDQILAGTYAATAEVVEAVEQPVPGEVTDVDGLGLPALGAALTSRFPFSIPWDFFRAIQLLAAPAKAPYFEMDFLEPMEHRVRKWQGNTTVVLDFSEYAIIGQVCRWTSTVGFCLMLAGATKRLIWTA